MWFSVFDGGQIGTGGGENHGFMGGYVGFDGGFVRFPSSFPVFSGSVEFRLVGTLIGGITERYVGVDMSAEEDVPVVWINNDDVPESANLVKVVLEIRGADLVSQTFL